MIGQLLAQLPGSSITQLTLSGQDLSHLSPHLLCMPVAKVSMSQTLKTSRKLDTRN